MAPYIVLICVPAVFALFANFFTYHSERFKSGKWIIGSFFTIMILLLSFRGIECGIDIANYEILFDETMENSFAYVIEAYDIEYGFHLIEYFTAVTTGSFRFFLVLIALISVVPIWILYSKESTMPYLTVILFAAVCPFSLYFSGIRQACAMAFMMPAYYFVKNKKLVPFLIVCTLASLFHISALMMFVFYPLYHFRLGRRTAIAFAGVAVFLLVANESIFKAVLLGLGGKYAEKYAFIQNTGAYTTVILMLIFLAYSFIVPDEGEIDYDTKGLRNTLFLLVMIQCFAPVNTAVMRLNYYYMLLLPLLIPKIVSYSKKSIRTVTGISVYAMCIFFTFWFFNLAINSEDILEVFPYVSVFES